VHTHTIRFIGYILVDKNTAKSGHYLNRNTVFQKDLSDIAEYIIQHGHSLIRQGMHQISQGRQFHKKSHHQIIELEEPKNSLDMHSIRKQITMLKKKGQFST
jgi:hypothetical protein